MGLPRSRYVKDGEEGVYHCFSRCVRRAFLCGFDKVTGRDFSHRKAWLVDRLRCLASIFAIEVCAYAVMETHYHTVVRTRPDISTEWSDREVAVRWLRLFPRLRDRVDSPTQPAEQDIRALTDVPERIELLRKRLCSLSWFMGRLNEYIARAANKEDGVKGRFWESRFKCQALLDEAAIACCMAYVDLNLIRAGLAGTPEECDFTSIQERIRAWQKESANVSSAPLEAARTSMHVGCDEGLAAGSVGGGGIGSPIQCDVGSFPEASVCWLCPIGPEGGRRGILQMTTAEYFDLVDRSGRMTRLGKRGAMDADLAPILTRIGVRPEAWVETVSCFGSRFRLAAGLVSNLRSFADRLGRHWLQGTAAARAAFS